MARAGQLSKMPQNGVEAGMGKELDLESDGDQSSKLTFDTS